MKFNYNFRNATALAITLATLSACSHGPIVQEYPPTANATEEVQKLNSEMQAALMDQMNILAPNSFERAQKSLDAARKDQDKSKDSKDILHQVAEGHSHLNQAREFAQLAKSNIEEVVAARQLALETGAPNFFERDFNKADRNLKRVTSDVEKNDLRSASENRGKLQAEYRDLELRSIQESSLGQARQTVEKAEKEGAKDFASQTLAIANKKIRDTTAFILANRHEMDQIKIRSDDATASADHVLKITRNSKANTKASSEDTALKLEKAEGMTEDTQAQLNKERDSAVTLVKTNTSLESDQAFNQSFEQARTQFSEEEAEVYKQGDKLLIRLKGLEFPVAKSLLKGSNFPLLAKVQKVIVGFGKSSVVVEGHTDSDGRKATNDKLSKARAEAVSDYLTSTIASDTANISSIGFGDQKPLSSNKTPAGKAQNRRVDIVISPERT